MCFFLYQSFTHYFIQCYNVYRKLRNEGMPIKTIDTFDFNKKPQKESFYLTPIAFGLSFPEVWKRHLKINKVNMKGLKPPYILLCTHHAFIDFKVTTAAIFPHRANYVIAIDGFINREWLVRHAGGIGKRKFTNDTRLIKQIKYSLNQLNNICAIYPEARYSLAGTTAILPDALGKLIKLLKKPVVVLNMHGNYLSQPVWNLKKRKVNIEADMTQILTEKDVQTVSVETINERIHKAFQYDEYQWQFDHQIKIDDKNRAKNIHKVLYQCPHCHQSTMISDKHELTCTSCHQTYEMDVYGRLHAQKGETKFSHVPDWYEWQREQVKQELLKDQYYFEDEVMIESLPNAKGFIPLGDGHLVHDKDGFHLTSKDKKLELNIQPLSMYGLHIEYDYMGKGDCIDLSTLENTYYIYPKHKKNVVTKLHFAVEEMYKLYREQLKNEVN